MKKTTANWLASADYDIQTAEAMLKSQRYLYVVFMCHLAIEKTLKALYSEAKASHPPKTHDLIASIPTRYPEDLQRLISQYPRRTATSYLSRTRKAIQWLRKDRRLTEK